MRNCLASIIVFYLSVSQCFAAAGIQSPIRVCDDIAEWPPFIYKDRNSRSTKTIVKGLSVDVIKDILSTQELKMDLELLPWKRCLSELERGHLYDMLLNASYSQERAEKYLFSIAYYTVTPHYFYSKKHYPNGLNILAKENLSQYRVGGMLGYNYSYWGLQEADVETSGIYSFEVLISRLHHGTIDLFVENYEVIAGFSKVGRPLLVDKNLHYERVPDMEPTPFYMMFSRTPRGEALRKLVNTGLQDWKDSGRLKKLVEASLMP